MEKEIKKFAEIDGCYWEASYPLCAGCPELEISGRCCYEGNGCRYPEERKKNPKSFRTAFIALLHEKNETVEAVRGYEKKFFEKN